MATNTGTYRLKTWLCDKPGCNYKQNFPQTRENIAIHFKGWGLTSNQCPSCKNGEIKEMSGVDLEKMTKAVFHKDVDIDALTDKDTETDEEISMADEKKQEKHLDRAKQFKKAEGIIFDSV